MTHHLGYPLDGLPPDESGNQSWSHKFGQ
jgi:hypothetical protein